jgi:hypothetical protein
MCLFDRFCAAVLVIGLATMTLALQTAQGQSVQQAPDFASICPKIAMLEDGKAIEAIVLPFGDVDIDNDGKTEGVTEVIQGSLGVHAIAVARGGAAAQSTTCEGCVSAFTNRARVVAIDGRNYVIEYSSGYLARLWEMLADGSANARCWFQPQHVPQIEAALDLPLCEAVLNGMVGHVPIAALPRKQQAPLPAVPELAIYPNNSRRVSEVFRADLDNDGTEENLIQLAMSSVSCQSRHAIMILDAAGLPEISSRNTALSMAQAYSCHAPRYGVIEFGGRFYLEGTVKRDYPTPDAAPARPFWNILELTSSATRELCRFQFQSTTKSFVAG